MRPPVLAAARGKGPQPISKVDVGEQVGKAAGPVVVKVEVNAPACVEHIEGGAAGDGDVMDVLGSNVETAAQRSSRQLQGGFRRRTHKASASRCRRRDSAQPASAAAATRAVAGWRAVEAYPVTRLLYVMRKVMGWCPFRASRKAVGAHRGFVTSTVNPAALRAQSRHEAVAADAHSAQQLRSGADAGQGTMRQKQEPQASLASLRTCEGGAVCPAEEERIVRVENPHITNEKVGDAPNVEGVVAPVRKVGAHFCVPAGMGAADAGAWLD